MKKEFTKKDLKSGDIIVCRDGLVGIVLLDIDTIVFKNEGYDQISNYTDDLIHEFEEAGHICKVFRGEPSFSDYEEKDLLFYKEYPAIEKVELPPVIKEENQKPREFLSIVTQAFYGNRMWSTIDYEDIDRFILGYQTRDWEITEPIDRTVIKIPNSKCVLVYNKYQEEEYIEKTKKWHEEDGYIAKPLATIPELNLEIYSRCFICRINEDGKLINIEDEDVEIVERYLAI